MYEPSEAPPPDERLPNGGRPTGPCELHRALVDIEGPAAPQVIGGCSAEPPEQRSFPPAPAGEPSYFLCNAHLRDVFDALDRARTKPPAH